MGANTRAKVVSVGLKGNTDISCKVLENDISGLTLEINGHEMTSRLVVDLMLIIYW